MQVKRILFFSNGDWHFYAHLLPIAIAAKAAGYEVSLLTKVTDYQTKIEYHGIKVIPIYLNRKSLNPCLEIVTFLQVLRALHRERPEILHSFTIKPIIYGSVGAIFYHKIKVINNFLGMGFIFINRTLTNRLVSKIIATILKLVAKRRAVEFIVQNADDQQTLTDLRITEATKIIVQCSVGVDTKAMLPLSEPAGRVIFALVSRMLVDKGVWEFVAAAEKLKARAIEAEFWLVGAPDEQNRSSLTHQELEAIVQKGIVKYLGFQEISRIWQQAHVAVLPSYREGLSRSLLEAGAYSRAIITTRAPGGTDLVEDQVDGLLVAPRDALQLADAMESLVIDPALRQSLGSRMRKKVESYYDHRIVTDKILRRYHQQQ